MKILSNLYVLVFYTQKYIYTVVFKTTTISVYIYKITNIYNNYKQDIL